MIRPYLTQTQKATARLTGRERDRLDRLLCFARFSGGKLLLDERGYRRATAALGVVSGELDRLVETGHRCGVVVVRDAGEIRIVEALIARLEAA